MAKQIWAIDLGDWSLKVVRGTCVHKTGTVTVDLYDEIVYGTLPCGYDASPTERQREGLIAFHKKYEIESGDDLALCISGSEVFCRFINLPPVPESIADIIRYEARQQIPFDIDDVVWDYQPVQEEYELGEEIEVALFALKKDRLNDLMDMLGEWRRNLRIIQNAPLALYNFLHYEGRTDEPLILLDVGSVTADLLVLNPPRFWLRTLLTAGGDLTRVLMQRFKIGATEAERLKRRLGASEHKDRILQIFQPIVDDITNEVQRSLGYYKSLARDVRFDRMLTVGSAMRLEGLSEMVGKGLQYEVMQLDSLNRLELDEAVNREAFVQALPGLGSVLGLLVQGAGQGRMQVNMVPDEVSFANDLNRKRPWLLVASLCLLVAAAVLVGGEFAIKPSLQKSQAETEAVFPGGLLSKVEKWRGDYGKLKNDLTTQETRAKKGGRAGISETIIYEVLPPLLDALPERVYFRRMEVVWRDSYDLKIEDWEKKSSAEGEPYGEARPEERADYEPPPYTGEDDYEPPPYTGEDDAGAPEMTLLVAKPGEPLAGAKSKLYVFFEAETPRIEEGFVETEVLAHLERALFRPSSVKRLFGEQGAAVPLFAKGALKVPDRSDARVLLGKGRVETVSGGSERNDPRPARRSRGGPTPESDDAMASSTMPSKIRVFSGVAVFNIQGDFEKLIDAEPDEGE
jgi:type IV pilus assembly protein PilM